MKKSKHYHEPKSYSRTHERVSELKLLTGILERAIADIGDAYKVVKPGKSHKDGTALAAKTAFDWIYSDRQYFCNHYLMVCYHLDLDPQWLRKEETLRGAVEYYGGFEIDYTQEYGGLTSFGKAVSIARENSKRQVHNKGPGPGEICLSGRDQDQPPGVAPLERRFGTRPKERTL